MLGSGSAHKSRHFGILKGIIGTVLGEQRLCQNTEILPGQTQKTGSESSSVYLVPISNDTNFEKITEGGAWTLSWKEPHGSHDVIPWIPLTQGQLWPWELRGFSGAEVYSVGLQIIK